LIDEELAVPLDEVVSCCFFGMYGVGVTGNTTINKVFSNKYIFSGILGKIGSYGTE
jgi:hypothetical protein